MVNIREKIIIKRFTYLAFFMNLLESIPESVKEEIYEGKKVNFIKAIQRSVSLN